MQKYRKIIILIVLTFLLAGCGQEKYKINEKITLRGTVSTTEITKDDETEKIKVLNLDKPIIVDGTKINKIELDYDRNLKDDYNVTIVGTIKENGKSSYDLSYAFEVIDIDDVLSFVNTFGNDDFTFAIPSDLIKKVIIKEIDRGFTVSSSDNPSYEIFRIVAVTKEEFNKLKNDKSGNIQKVNSNYKKVVIIQFNSDDDDNQNYEITSEIVDNINKIKSTIQLK